MRKGVALLAMAAAAVPASAVLIYTGGTVTENFDTLPTTTQTGIFGSVIGVQTPIPGSTFDGAKIGGTGTTGMSLIADFGDSNAGGIHSLGAAGSGERALGLLASGTNIPAVGVEIRNGLNVALASMTVSFTQENWRDSTSVQNVMTAAWGQTGGGMTSADYLTHAAMVAVPSLDLIGPPPVTTNGPLDGNNPINQAPRIHVFTFTTPVRPGESVFIRWQDFNDAGNDADLALDNLSVTADVVPEPATLAVLGVGAIALMRRRR